MYAFSACAYQNSEEKLKELVISLKRPDNPLSFEYCDHEVVASPNFHVKESKPKPLWIHPPGKSTKTKVNDLLKCKIYGDPNKCAVCRRRYRTKLKHFNMTSPCACGTYSGMCISKLQPDGVINCMTAVNINKELLINTTDETTDKKEVSLNGVNRKSWSQNRLLTIQNIHGKNLSGNGQSGFDTAINVNLLSVQTKLYSGLVKPFQFEQQISIPGNSTLKNLMKKLERIQEKEHLFPQISNESITKPKLHISSKTSPSKSTSIDSYFKQTPIDISAQNMDKIKKSKVHVSGNKIKEKGQSKKFHKKIGTENVSDVDDSEYSSKIGSPNKETNMMETQKEKEDLSTFGPYPEKILTTEYKDESVDTEDLININDRRFYSTTKSPKVTSKKTAKKTTSSGLFPLEMVESEYKSKIVSAEDLSSHDTTPEKEIKSLTHEGKKEKLLTINTEPLKMLTLKDKDFHEDNFNKDLYNIIKNMETTVEVLTEEVISREKKDQKKDKIPYEERSTFPKTSTTDLKIITPKSKQNNKKVLKKKLNDISNNLKELGKKLSKRSTSKRKTSKISNPESYKLTEVKLNEMIKTEEEINLLDTLEKIKLYLEKQVRNVEQANLKEKSNVIWQPSRIQINEIEDSEMPLSSEIKSNRKGILKNEYSPMSHESITDVRKYEKDNMKSKEILNSFKIYIFNKMESYIKDQRESLALFKSLTSLSETDLYDRRKDLLDLSKRTLSLMINKTDSYWKKQKELLNEYKMLFSDNKLNDMYNNISDKSDSSDSGRTRSIESQRANSIDSQRTHSIDSHNNEENGNGEMRRTSKEFIGLSKNVLSKMMDKTVSHLEKQKNLLRRSKILSECKLNTEDLADIDRIPLEVSKIRLDDQIKLNSRTSNLSNIVITEITSATELYLHEQEEFLETLRNLLTKFELDTIQSSDLQNVSSSSTLDLKACEKDQSIEIDSDKRNLTSYPTKYTLDTTPTKGLFIERMDKFTETSIPKTLVREVSKTDYSIDSMIPKNFTSIQVIETKKQTETPKPNFKIINQKEKDFNLHQSIKKLINSSKDLKQCISHINKVDCESLKENVNDFCNIIMKQQETINKLKEKSNALHTTLPHQKHKEEITKRPTMPETLKYQEKSSTLNHDVDKKFISLLDKLCTAIENQNKERKLLNAQKQNKQTVLENSRNAKYPIKNFRGSLDKVEQLRNNQTVLENSRNVEYPIQNFRGSLDCFTQTENNKTVLENSRNVEYPIQNFRGSLDKVEQLRNKETILENSRSAEYPIHSFRGSLDKVEQIRNNQTVLENSRSAEYPIHSFRGSLDKVEQMRNDQTALENSRSVEYPIQNFRGSLVKVEQVRNSQRTLEDSRNVEYPLHRDEGNVDNNNNIILQKSP